MVNSINTLHQHQTQFCKQCKSLKTATTSLAVLLHKTATNLRWMRIALTIAKVVTGITKIKKNFKGTIKGNMPQHNKMIDMASS